MLTDVVTVTTDALIGPRGIAVGGNGVPVGGTTLQVLTKIDGISFNTQWSTVDKTFVGLGNVNNTSDANKPISTATQLALDAKQASLGFTPENVANKSTSGALGTSNTLYPTQYAVKTYADNLLGDSNALVYKGVLDCSTNPNYPAASSGHLYIVSVAGKVGGASGTSVDVGDMLLCNTDSTASGTQAAVGQYWNIVEKNIVGAVTGPGSAVSNNVAFFDGVTGKVIKDSGLTLSGSNTGDNATNTQYSGLDAAKVNRAGDTMTGNLNLSTNKLIGGTGVTDILKLQGTTGNGTSTSPAIQLLTGNNGGTTALTVLNNGNVGIGTTTPGAKLQVDTGAATTVGQIIKAVSGQSANLQEWYDSTSILQLCVTPYGGLALSNGASLGTTPALGLNFLGASNALRYSIGNGGTGDSTLYFSSRNSADNSRNDIMFLRTGNIAGVNNSELQLGPIAPGGGVYGAKLTVISTVSTQMGQIIRGAAAQTADLLQLQDSAANKLMVVSSGGNVGIGTTAPVSLLSLYSESSVDYTADLRIESKNSGAVMKNSISFCGNWLGAGLSGSLVRARIVSDNLGNAYNSAVLKLQTHNATSNPSWTDTLVLRNNRVVINGTDPTAQLQVNANSANLIGQIIKGAASQTADLLQIQDSAGASLVNVTAGGNVGIGTSSPAAKLEVNGDSAGIIARFGVNGTASGANRIFINSYDSNALVSLGRGGTSKWGIGNRSNMNDSFVISTSGDAMAGVKFSVDPNGLVGINLDSASPGAQLQINTNSAATTGQIIKGAASQTANLQQWQDSAGTVLASITASGWLGIKTTEPNSTLQVNGSVSKAYVAKTANYTLTANDHVVDCTGTFTITLPPASGITGREYIIKNSGTGTITVDGDSVEKIDGQLTQVLSQYESLTIVSTNTSWIII